MNHFLSRLGRSNLGKYIVPTMFGTTVVGYFGIHTMGHNLIRKLFGAQGSDGRPVLISNELRDLITEVFTEVEAAGYHKDIIELKGFDYGSPPSIRWFISATLDPIVYGSTDFKTGCSIGIPNYYNYQDSYDLPDEIFDMKKLSFMKTPQGRELDKQIELDKDVLLGKQEKGPTVLMSRIDRNSIEGKEFSDSLILSENAKRFSIARELYVCDTLKPVYQVFAVGLAFIGSITFARAQVTYLKLKDRHVTQRIPAYALSALAAYCVYYFLSQAGDDYVNFKANERANKLGDNYAVGSEEYFKKREIRNAIIKNHTK